MVNKLDIVMVAYRSEGDLPDLLPALRSMTRSEHTLHFHDNIGNTKTLTIAWNDLARQGSAEYIAFLNTDIRVSPEWDTRLIEGFDRHPDAGVLLPRPIGHDWPKLANPSQSAYADPKTAPAPTQEAMTAIAELYREADADYSFGGACNAAFYAVLVRRSTFESLHGFDERFRFYGQDHDFQRRLLARFGKYTVVVTRSPVWHRCGGSVHQAALRGEVDFNAEMRHCGAMAHAVQSGSAKAWDELSDADRLRVRVDPQYNRMPVHR